MFSGMTFTFLREFAWGFGIASPVLATLAVIILLIGQVVGKREGWSKFDSFYWGCVTATTVGYGDLRPTKRESKLLAILIAILGLILSGILIAIAVRAATIAMQTHGNAP
jgi:voltage-gated potassium channel